MIGSEGFDRILRCQRHERHWQLVGPAVNADLQFLHRLEKRGLYLRRGTVDLVRQQEVAHRRTRAVFTLSGIHIHRRVSHNVRRHEVRRELDSAKAAGNALRQRFRKQGLAYARDVLYQHMTSGEHGADHLLNDRALSDYNALDITDELFDFTVHDLPSFFASSLFLSGNYGKNFTENSRKYNTNT